MKNHLLLPNKCRLIGWVLLPLGLMWLIATSFLNVTVFEWLKVADKSGKQKGIFDTSNTLFSPDFSADLNLTFALVLTFLGLFMVAFAKEKMEDEYVRTVRLHAFQLSVYTNYIVLFLTTIFLYDSAFLVAMEVNLFTILIIFIAVYYYILHIKPRLSKSTEL